MKPHAIPSAWRPSSGAVIHSSSLRNPDVTLRPMKSKHAKTGFDRHFTERMKDRKFASAYIEARAGIDSVDAFVRSLDEVRSKAGVSKALLAKRTGTQPAAMRRLLTMDAPNPTLATVMSIVRSLGYSLTLVPAQGRAKRGRARKLAGVLAATA